MSARRTLGDVRAIISRELGICSTDSRVPEYVNQAQEILLNRGKWVNTYQRYRICADPAGCITWPRQIETIEAFGVCQWPGIVRNEWFEWNQNGVGLASDCNTDGNTLIDRGSSCQFADVVGDAVKMKVYADVAEDSDAVILLQGYDENANWIRTFVDGNWIDGEEVAISTTPTYSTKRFLQPGLIAVQKPVTNGVVRIYGYNVTTTALQSLAIYESDETRPLYRRSQIPGLSGAGGCCGSESSEDCDTKQVTVMAKLRFIPVINDADWLIISNLQALKLMVKAILKQERNLIGEAEAYEGKAVKELQKELDVYEGDGAIVMPRFESGQTWGVGGVVNVCMP